MLGISWANLWHISGLSRAYHWYILGLSWVYHGDILHAQSISAKRQSVSAKWAKPERQRREGRRNKKQALDHPLFFNGQILFLCSFLFSFFKSCHLARWTNSSKWITVLYLHLRWSCLIIIINGSMEVLLKEDSSAPESPATATVSLSAHKECPIVQFHICFQPNPIPPWCNIHLRWQFYYIYIYQLLSNPK